MLVNTGLPVIRWPTSSTAAARLLTRPGAVLVAGGTLELPRWHREGQPAEVICIARIPGLARITATSCGAAATLNELATSPCLPGAMREAAATVGGPALRAGATVGGNVAGRSPGCLTTILLALDAQVDLTDTLGKREWLPLAEWCNQSSEQRSAVLTGFRWQRPIRLAFSKVATRAAGGKVLVTAAGARTYSADGSLVTRLAVGGHQILSQGWHADAVSGGSPFQLTGRPLIRSAGEIAVSDLAYRQELAAVLVDRVFRTVTL